jgi:hypothetical protein
MIHLTLTQIFAELRKETFKFKLKDNLKLTLKNLIIWVEGESNGLKVILVAAGLCCQRVN